MDILIGFIIELCGGQLRMYGNTLSPSLRYVGPWWTYYDGMHYAFGFWWGHFAFSYNEPSLSATLTSRANQPEPPMPKPYEQQVREAYYATIADSGHAVVAEFRRRVSAIARAADAEIAKLREPLAVEGHNAMAMTDLTHQQHA